MRRPPHTSVPRSAIVVLIALTVGFLNASSAGAHVLSNAPQYESAVQSVPDHVHMSTVSGTKALRVSVDAGHSLLIAGYDGEPLIRIDASGVAINRHSPTSFAIRAGARDEVPTVDLQHPQWLVLDPGGRTLTYHDQRIAWVASGRPHGVSIWTSGRQRVHAWSIPVQVDGGPITQVRGTLYYTGGNSPWATIAELAVVLILCGFVARSLLRNRHRARARARPNRA